MTPELQALLAAAGLWVGLHVLVAGSPLRRAVAGRIGEPGFQGMFSLLSLVALGLLIWTYHRAAAQGVNFDVWVPTRAALWAPIAVMPIAWLLFVGSVSGPNPTSVGMEKALHAPEPARGILRITRHPMLWSFVLWSVAHASANGDAATLVLCAAIALPSLWGMRSIDRKRARRDPEGWQRYAAVTSITPFAAIVGGRNRLALAEIGPVRVLVALLVTAVVVAAHPHLFGASALPF